MKLKCLLAGTLAICLGINSNVVVFAKKSEYVKDLQHKIDKALESDPSYEELIEIRDDYDELLKSEQEQIKNYDKIEEMFTVSEEVVAGVFERVAQGLVGMGGIAALDPAGGSLGIGVVDVFAEFALVADAGAGRQHPFHKASQAGRHLKDGAWGTPAADGLV